ncbi:MAG: hypothetical protein U1D30_01700 [Planctomycetota bacterium]
MVFRVLGFGNRRFLDTCHPLGARGEQPESKQDEAKIWEQWASTTYKSLNDKFEGELTPVFQSLGGMRKLQEFFDKERHPKKYEAYRAFFLEAVADGMHKDVVEAIFANVLMLATPPRVVLELIAPEIGPQGRLAGILDGPNADVARYIQWQEPQGYAGPANFVEYEHYLKGGRSKGIHAKVNADIIIVHMFREDPQHALATMLSVVYGFESNARGNCYLHVGQEIAKVRELQLAHAEIGDFLFRTRYSFPLREGQGQDVSGLLAKLCQQEQWWVRLYVANLVGSQPKLSSPELLGRLVEDSNESVRAAASRARENR